MDPTPYATPNLGPSPGPRPIGRRPIGRRVRRGWLLGVAIVAIAAPGAAVAQVEVPLRVENGWFVVPVTVDDTVALTFIVDTGAAMSAVTHATLRRLGRVADGTVRAQGASGAQTLPVARLQSLALGGVRAFNPRVLVLDERVLTPDAPGEGRAYDGVLGADVFGDHDLLLDPVAGVLRLFYEDGDTSRSLPPLGAPLRMWRIAGPILGHDVEINGSVMPAILDTGARRVVVSPRGARNARATAIPGSERTGTPGVGSEEVRWQDVDLERVRAGGTELGSVPAQVGALPIFRSLGFGDRAVVLLGNPALRTCPVLISYRTDTIRYCLRPAAS